MESLLQDKLSVESGSEATESVSSRSLDAGKSRAWKMSTEGLQV